MTHWPVEWLQARLDASGKGSPPAKPKRRAVRFPAVPEADVLAGCLQLLAVHPKIAFAYRRNVGGFTTECGDFVKFGFAGQADISAMRKGSGRLIEIEVKRPGKAPTAKQNQWLYAVNQGGGYGIWVDSVDRLKFLLDKL